MNSLITCFNKNDDHRKNPVELKKRVCMYI